MTKTLCILCGFRAGTHGELMAHVNLKPDHSGPNEKECNCDICCPAMSGYAHNDPRRKFSYKHPRPINHTCEPCGRQIFCCSKKWTKHTKQKTHVGWAKLKGYYCQGLRKYFFDSSSWRSHCVSLHLSDVEYHCMDCNTDFLSQCALDTHPKKDAVHQKRVSGISCKPCGKSFISNSELAVHKRSKEHKENTRKVKCWASPKCSRMFVNNGAMLSHLESGACVSKIDRHQIDNVIRQHDTNNVVLKVEYSAPQGRHIGDTPRSQSALSATAAATPLRSYCVVAEPWDEDSDDDESMIATPTTLTYRAGSGSSSSSFIPTPTRLPSEPSFGSSGFATPTATVSESRFSFGSSSFATPAATASESRFSFGSSSFATPAATASESRFSFGSSGFATPAATVSESGFSFGVSGFATPRSRLSDSSMPSANSGQLTPRFSGFSTPRSTSIHPSRSNELDPSISLGNRCHICQRKFISRRALEAHLQSLAHAPRIYHCPTSLFSLPGLEKEEMRDFKSLSGLVMHLESGACKGGAERLDMAISYVQEKLKGSGAGVKLLE